MFLWSLRNNAISEVVQGVPLLVPTPQPSMPRFKASSKMLDISTAIFPELIMVADFTTVLAYRFGAPLLLGFLSLGLLVGEDELGLKFNDASLAYLIGSLALAVILFDSGFRTRFASFTQP